MDIADKKVIQQLFAQVREKKPLIHQITNTVTINDCANATLAIGALPVMASSPNEAADMVKLANALVINIGTLQTESFEAMKLAGKMANQLGIPVIFDPVGVGATSYRSTCAFSLLKEVKVSIIRGNASEMDHLAGGSSITKGVDTGQVAGSHQQIAARVARTFDCIAVVSGENDAISDGSKTVQLMNGHPLLTNITGTGCMSTALIASFAAITADFFFAAIAGTSLMGIVGEEVATRLTKEEGTGTFKAKLMDNLFLMDGKKWLKGVKIRHAD